MTPPAAFDAAKFRRIADGLVSGIKGSLDTMFMDSVERAEIALRYAATLADELERVYAELRRMKLHQEWTDTAFYIGVASGRRRNDELQRYVGQQANMLFELRKELAAMKDRT